MNKISNELIPSESEELLLSLKNMELIGMIRDSWVTEQDFINEYQDEEDMKITKNDVFSLTQGAVLLYFNNRIMLGVGSQDSLWSVTVWSEQQKFCKDHILTDPNFETFPLDASNYKPWKNFLGKRVTGITYMTQKKQYAFSQNCPCEVGLLITLENSLQFVIGLGIHEINDFEFVIISPSEISKYWSERLDFRKIF